MMLPIPLETLTAIHTLCAYAGKPDFSAIRDHAKLGMKLSAWPFATPPKVGNLLSGPNALSWDLLNSPYL